MNLPKDHPILRKPIDEEGLKWHLPFEAPFRFSGLNWFEQYPKYERIPSEILPQEATRFQCGEKKVLPREKWGVPFLAKIPTGAQIQFRSDTACVYVDVIAGESSNGDNISLIGSNGYDLYFEGDDGLWRLAGVSRIDRDKKEFRQSLTNGSLTRKMRSFLLNFPLYCGVESIAIGLSDDAIIEPPKPWSDTRPIVWYGTSITQGGCASHPGLAATNILSRIRNQPVYNFGFSGNGCGEPEMAEIIASVENPAIFIIDNCWNIGTIEELNLTLPPFIDIIRARHPKTPIYLMSGTPGAANFEGHLRNPGCRPNMKDILKDEVTKRLKAGDDSIYFIDGETLIGEDFWDCVVDMVHLSDKGFIRQARNLAPLLK